MASFRRRESAPAARSRRRPPIGDGPEATQAGSPAHPAHAALLALQRTAGNAAVSRLIDVDTFKSESSAPGLRIAIKAVDTALGDYHRVPIGQYQRRRDALDALIRVCATYIGAKHKARTDAVVNLRGQAIAERAVFDRLVQAQGASPETRRLAQTGEAHELALQAMEDFGEERMGNLHNVGFQQLVTDSVARLRTQDPDEVRRLVRADVDRLDAIRQHPGLPSVTRDVLTEILANADEVRFEEFRPGTTLSGPGVPEKYTVKNTLSHPDGETERVGSLAHELTHVAAGEAYDNTALLLLFDPALAETDVQALAARRNTYIAELRALLASEPLSPSRKYLITNKLDYASGDKLLTYVANFLRAKKIDTATADRLKALAGLVPNNSVLVEYDTVLNQILVYLHMWNVPASSPFYVRLQAIARIAYGERQNALTARAAPAAAGPAAAGP